MNQPALIFFGCLFVGALGGLLLARAFLKDMPSRDFFDVLFALFLGTALLLTGFLIGAKAIGAIVDSNSPPEPVRIIIVTATPEDAR